VFYARGDCAGGMLRFTSRAYKMYAQAIWIWKSSSDLRPQRLSATKPPTANITKHAAPMPMAVRESLHPPHSPPQFSDNHYLSNLDDLDPRRR
jgi:hypothetical protein